MKTAILLFLTASMAMGQATKPAKPVVPTYTYKLFVTEDQSDTEMKKECLKYNVSPENCYIFRMESPEPVSIRAGGVVSVAGKDGRIERLSDDEYARLQKLRQAVADAEKEVAKAHGVDFIGCQLLASGNYTCNNPPDTYEFRGQFLLINVPKQSGGKP